MPVGAKPCDGKNQGRHRQERPQPLQIAGLSDGWPVVATGCESSSGGIRTPDTRIMIPLVSVENLEKNAPSENCAAHMSAVEIESSTIDPELKQIFDRWPNLPEPIKAGILAMVEAACDNEVTNPHPPCEIRT